MSWAGFWIKLANAPARVALCVTTYLSIKLFAITQSVGRIPEKNDNAINSLNSLHSTMSDSEFFIKN